MSLINGRTWGVYDCRKIDGTIHVAPQWQEHEFSLRCWCHPVVVDGVISHCSQDENEDEW